MESGFGRSDRDAEGPRLVGLAAGIRPDNHGVLLRRTLDYQYANQRALVFVFHDGEWHLAGVWYLAGSNTVYHSFPVLEGELGRMDADDHVESRFRDDEFLLPVALTQEAFDPGA